MMIFFPLQKKAEEAHKIFEGLGPKVELVSSLATYSLFVNPVLTICEGDVVRGMVMWDLT